MDKKVDQKMESVLGVGYMKFAEQTRELMEKWNAKGYELTCINTQCNNGDTTQSVVGILIFTKKEQK